MNEHTTQARTPANRARAARRVRLCLAVLSWTWVSVFILGVASYFTSFALGFTLGSTTRFVGFARGDLRFVSSPALPGTRPLQFRTDADWRRSVPGGSRLRVPFAVIAAGAFLPFSMLGYRAMLAERRARRGLCKRCEYDLSGIEIQGGYKACPECGTTKRVWRDQDATA